MITPTTQRLITFILFIGISFECTLVVNAQSIWKHRKPNNVFLFTDTAARNVGDLVTVLVQENTDVDNSDQRALDKKSSDRFGFDLAASGDVGSVNGDFTIGDEADRQFSGNSEFTVEREFTDRITAQVVDVLPNGNLVVIGRRRRVVAGEIRTLLVSGSVRTMDISPNNTVKSQFLANFKVCYEGDGPESHFSNQGWGSRLVNRIWPF